MIKNILIFVNILLIFIGSTAIVLSSYLSFSPSYEFLRQSLKFKQDVTQDVNVQVNVIQISVISMISLFALLYIAGVLGLAGAVTKLQSLLRIYKLILGILFFSMVIKFVFISSILLLVN